MASMAKSSSSRRGTRWLYVLLFFLYVGAIVYLCFGNFSALSSKMPLTILGIRTDRIVHFLMFFPYIFLAQAAFAGKNPWKTLVWVTISAIALAYALELLQGVVTTSRTTDPWDLSINLSAVTTATLIMAIATSRRGR